MSDAMTKTVPDAIGPAAKLQLVGEADAEACVGEFCELPAHREQSVMNRRIDSDQI
jgi:hypothetical protein